MKNKKFIQSMKDSIKHYMNCESVEFETVSSYMGGSGGVSFYTYEQKYVCWYSPCGAPDSEWSEFTMHSGVVSLTANQLRGK